jgi:organic radical activating enzyme
MTTEAPARDWLLVSEQFLSHQGEGPSTGRLAKFLRLGGCNQACHWCDTPYSWVYDDRHVALHDSGKKYNPAEELKRHQIGEITEWLATPPFAPLCVITGGEPMLQRDQLERMISAANEELNYRFEIETAGTIHPGPLLLFQNVDYNVSPKLASSGNPYKLRYQPEVLRAFAESWATFKFVVDTRKGMTAEVRDDISEIRRIIRDCEIPPRNVWLMPCGTISREVVDGMRVLAPVAAESGWNVSTRLHILAYENQRGI